MVKYNQSIIYKLCCLDPSIMDIYIGSTTNRNRRKQQHKNNCNNENIKDYNFYVYQFIRDTGGWINWDFVEIEQFNATDKSDLHKRERHWIEELKSTLNKRLPTRTVEQYREANKDKIKELKKEYREQNKDKIKEYYKQYIEQHKEMINCPCGGKYDKSNKFKQTKHYNTIKHKTYTLMPSIGI